MSKFLCKINGELVSQEEFESVFIEEATKSDVWDLEQAEAKLSTFGFIRLNGIDFEIEELEETEEEKIMDNYKVEVLKNILNTMQKDEFYTCKVKGDDTKAINLDKGAIKLLIEYYSK